MPNKSLAVIGLMFVMLPVLAKGVDHPTQPTMPTKTMLLDMGEGCRIRVEAPIEAQGGALRAQPDKNVQGRANIGITSPPRAKKAPYEDVFGLRFSCFDISNEVVQSGWATKNTDGSWRLNLSPHDKTYYKPGNIAIHEVATPNASGWAVHVDDMIGDERARRRRLFYCVTHEEKAVCGNSFMGYLPEIHRHSKNDLTPYALRILRSIEFLDDTAGSVPPVAAPSLPGR